MAHFCLLTGLYTSPKREGSSVTRASGVRMQHGLLVNYRPLFMGFAVDKAECSLTPSDLKSRAAKQAL
jgi:hypothetical protein